MKKHKTSDIEICCGNCKHFTFIVSSTNKLRSYGFCNVGKEPENTAADMVCNRKFEK